MGESTSHRHLVKALVQGILELHPDVGKAQLYIDSDEHKSNGLPPSIFGHIPDVYLRERNSKYTVIGEAKTAKDIESRRSRSQYTAYVKWAVSHQPTSIVIATPWHCMAAAKNCLWNICVREKATSIDVLILECLGDESL